MQTRGRQDAISNRTRGQLMRPLGELRVPPIQLILLAVLLGQRKRSRVIEAGVDQMAAPAQDFAEFMNQRWADSDVRDSRITALTEQMTSMTATLLRLQIATVVLSVLSVGAAVLAITLT